MSHCLDCNSTYETPGTCNCFAPGGKRAPVVSPWRPTTVPADTTAQPWQPWQPITTTITGPEIDGFTVRCDGDSAQIMFAVDAAIAKRARAAYGANHPAAQGIVRALGSIS